MKRVFTALSVCAALSFAGCIDQEFDLADTSGEITVGGEELVVPLAEIDPIHLGDVIKDNEYFNSNGEDGTYQVQFSSYGDNPNKYESVKVDGISIPNITGLSPKLEPLYFTFGSLPTSLYFSGISKKVDLNLPSQIGQIMQIDPICITKSIDFAFPSQLSGQGTIDDQMLAILKMAGYSTLSKSGSESAVFDASLEIIEQLEKVDWVEFGCEDHPYGAPFNLKVDLKGLSDIVAGGSLKITVAFPEGYYLRDENGKDYPAATHNILAKEIAIAPKQKVAEVLIHLHKIDYSKHTFTSGKLDIHDEISYSYDLSVDLGKGSYNLNTLPQIAIQAEPKYKDVEVKINNFEAPTYEEYFTQSFNGLPSSVSIEKVAFTQDSKFNISLKGLEWCVVQDNLTGADISPKLEIDLPRSLHFREHPLLDENTNVLLASTTELARGIDLSLEYIDCKNSNGIKQENGQLLINEKIGAAIHMESLNGHTVLVSTITPPEQLNVVIGIADARLTIDTANTVVTWGDETSFDFNLDDNIPSFAQTIEVPEMIAKVERIEIGKVNSNNPVSITFKFESGTSFPVEELGINVAVNLGKLLRPTQKMFDQKLITTNNNGDYLLTINESWKPKQAALIKTLEFDALENIPDVVDGKVSINQAFPVTGSVKIKSGEKIDLSDLSNNAYVNVDVNIDDIEIRSFTGAIDFSLAPDEMVFELGDFSNLGVDLNNLSLNPILDIKLKDNPTNIPLSGDIAIKTLDKEGKTMKTLTIPTINVAGSGPTHLVLSTPRNAAKYAGVDGVTFIAVEGLSDLLADGIPAKAAVNLEAKTNKNETITIDLAKAKQGYNIEYQYSFVMPIEVDSDTNISFESSIMELGETFAELADTANGLKVGDVGLVAEFGSTIPVNVVLSAELVNANGTTDGVEARLNINNCVIAGYNKATDGEKKISTIDLDFDLGESGSLAGLKSADGVRFKLSIYGANEDLTALAKDQFLECKLKLRVRDGLTVDIFDILNMEN